MRLSIVVTPGSCVAAESSSAGVVYRSFAAGQRMGLSRNSVICDFVIAQGIAQGRYCRITAVHLLVVFLLYIL